MGQFGIGTKTGSKSVVMTAQKRDDPISKCLYQLQVEIGVARDGRGNGKQKCTHLVGHDDQRVSLGSQACECQPSWCCNSHNVVESTGIFLQDVKLKMR